MDGGSTTNPDDPTDGLLGGTAALLGAGWGAVWLAGGERVSRLLDRTRSRPLGGRLAGAWAAGRRLLRAPRALVAMGAVSLARWLYICEVNSLIFLAFSHRPGIVHLIAGTAIGRIVSLLPVTVGGVGLKEPVQMLIYADAGVPADVVVAVSVVGMACAFLLAALLPLLLRVRTEAVARA
jgi:uncharacterized membrane protein YbhN (UPF0104 family)